MFVDIGKIKKLFLIIFFIFPVFLNNICFANSLYTDMRIVVNLTSRLLLLYEGETVIRTYSIGVGKAVSPTPLGSYRIITKIVNPEWENPYLPRGQAKIKPGKNNPLGTRWMGFKEYKSGEYGIHGTNRPDSVGKTSSHGCIRMKIKDSEELFEKVEIGTPVDIVD